MVCNIRDLIFPAKCVICDDVLAPTDGNGICMECRQYLRYIAEPVCMKCGKELLSEEEEYCFDCARLTRSYVRGFPLLNYVSPVKESLSRMKYEARQEYADFYGREIGRVFESELKKIKGAVLIPVPISEYRMKKRGYNQAELLAVSLGKKLGIPVDTKTLIRDIDTLPQKKLGSEDRMKNLMKAFKVSGRTAVPKAVILVDDIYTTGSTIEACTRVLMAAGCERVYYTAAAIGSGS